MTPEQAKKALPLITAFADGKIIEFLNSSGRWVRLRNADFSEDLTRYRIKPEPRKIRAIERTDGVIVCLGTDVGEVMLRPGEKFVEFVEVIPRS